MNNKLVIGGVVAVLVIVGLVIGFSGGSSPDKVVSQMFAKMSEVEVAAFELSMTMGSDSALFSGGDEGSGSILFSGAFDSSDVDNVKSKVAGDIRVQTGGSSFGLAIESLTLDKKVYIKAMIDNLPIPIDISSLNNRWIMVDVATVQEQFGSDYSAELTAEQQEQLRQAFRKSNLIKTTQVLPDEVVSGVDSYHYQYVVDEDALVEYFVRLMEITQDSQLDASQVTAFKTNLEKSFEEVEPFTGEIWIGKSDSLLYKITLSISGIDPTGERVSFDPVLTLKDYGLPLSLTAPASYITLEEAMGLLRSGN